MKSFFILTLAVGLLAGCTAKENNTEATAKSGSQPVNGETFLAENGKKEGVITTASGLQYKVLKSGSGESPRLTDRVKVHYHGTLIDGTVFDSSVQRGEPIVFPVGGVIPGWIEALQLMKVGDKWQLFIPANLAYGDRSPSPAIPPNSVLIFEVELLGIQK
jgi:FKBP-type peptidyl-prolyl cis-trans isomerase FklB